MWNSNAWAKFVFRSYYRGFIWTKVGYSGPACSHAGFLSNLHSGLRELRPLSQLLSGVDVWVMCPLKSFLQLLQLLGREGGAAASLFPLERQVGLRVHVRSVIYAVTWGEKKHRWTSWRWLTGDWSMSSLGPFEANRNQLRPILRIHI